MKQRPLWAIVLAGGEGSRLAETSRQVYGSCLPKQFLSFGRRRTFLQATLDRLAELIPASRTVVVVASAREGLAREQLSEFSGLEFVAQPKNLGTGPGVLLPLLSVLHRDALADVALVPSDHDFQTPRILLETLERAHHSACAQQRMVLVGAAAECAATDLGWIVPKRTLAPDGAGAIRRFVEKPPQALAEHLFREGALWNTMLSVTPAAALWELARRALPAHTEAFESHARRLGTPDVATALARLYEDLSPADFSRDLVAASAGLRVTSMAGAGWSDCGTPERLAAALGQPLGLPVKSSARNAAAESAVLGAV